MPLFNHNDNKILIDSNDRVPDYLANKIIDGPGVNVSSVSFLKPIVQYLINEASSGQAPTALIDNTASPLNLTLSYSGSDPSFTSKSTGRGLVWSGATSANNASAISATLGGTKVATALNNSKIATMEIVAAVNGANGFYFQIGDSGGNTTFGIYMDTANVLRYGQGTNASESIILPTDRAVYHLILDTTGPLDICYRIYRNGYFLGGSNFPLNQNDTIGSLNTSKLAIGNSTTNDDNALELGAAVYYTAIYAGVMSEAQIQRNAAALLLNDDEDPNSDFNDEVLVLDNTFCISAGTQYYFDNRVRITNGNNFIFGMNTANSVLTGAFPGIAQVAAGTQTATSGTLSFVGSNSVTFGMSASTRVTASIPAGATATGNIAAISAGTAQATSGTITFSNSNGFSFGMSGTTMVTGSFTPGTIPSAFSAAGSQVTTGTIILSNSNGISFGMNGNTITATADPNIVYSNLSAINNGINSITSGTVVFSNSGNITFGINGNTVTASMASGPALPISAISAGTTSINSGTLVLSNANGISFRINGSTVTASYGPVLSMFEYPSAQFASNSAGAYSDGTQGFVPFYLPLPVSATLGNMLFSINASSSTNNTMRGTISLAIGIYTNNAGTLSLASNGSQSYSWSQTSSGSTSVYNGPKILTVPLNLSMTPGQYWFGYWLHTSNGGATQGAIGMTHMGGLGQTNWSGPWGATSNSTQRLEDGLGYYNTSQATLLSSAVITNINHTDNIRMPWFAFRATS